MQVEIEKELFDESVERAVLSALMLDPHVLDDDPLHPKDFFFMRHQRVLEAIQALTKENTLPDLVSMNAELKQRGYLEEVGGAGWVAELACEIPSPSAGKNHAARIKEFSHLRNLQKLGKHILQNTQEGASSEEILKQIDIATQEVYGSQLGTMWQPIDTCVDETLDAIDLAYRESGVIGLSTGLTLLDRKIGGLSPGNLVVIAGRPGMGKTSLGLLLALTAAKAEATVGLLSLEMSSQELVTRMLAMQDNNLSVLGLDRGNFSKDAWGSIVTASKEISSKKIFVCDEASMTIDQLRMNARSLKRKHGLDLLVVDYLQLFETGRKAENRVAAMTEISRSLKVLAKEMGIPVVALSQLNRSCEGRTDKRPLLSDLRESGSIEQDADVVVFIYRDEVYDEESPDPGIAELLIRKNRNGPIGEVRVAWHAQQTRFMDLDN